ncbi:MAG TPA: biotin/lipoyl-binding protein [Candidatus Methylomirabilis sp.]|nr:biotin/lipoyl-binding protein [Candidatus Methylomirabilis sp.]
MEAILVGIYAFFVWLIYFKFKWLPWTTPHKVTVVIIPIVGLTALILLLNVFAPSSHDVRVIKYVVQIVPQVRGRVIDVPAAGNQHMKKGDVLFRIDPTPYELDVKRIEAQLALSQLRLRQTRALAATGAGSKFDEERYESDVRQLQAQLDQARWDLSQTTMYAPADGTPINVQLRPGSYVVSLPFVQAMAFVEDDYQVIALYHQNELYEVAPGDEAEIALPTYPGDIIKATVDSIVWAQGQGQLPLSGTIPQTGAAPLPPGRFAVKLALAEQDRALFLAAGAVGDAAIYTRHLEPIHILRKVILRVGSYTNYLILKLH